MANKIRNTARNFHAPVLPNPPAEYSQALTHQRDTTLRVYFQSIDEAITQALQYDTSDIIDGSIPNSKLENSTVSFGGVTLSLGESDATPAFNLSDATGYPTSSLVGTITTAQIADSAVTTAKIADDAVTDAKLADSINSAIAANTAKVTNATHTGEVTGATALTIADGAVVTARIADDAVTDAKLADSINSAIAANTAKVTNATHTGEVTGATALTIADGAVVTARIADDAVTAAKIDEAADITVAGLTVTPSSGSASAVVKATASNNFTAELHLGDASDTDAGRIQYVNATGSMGFFVENSERVRIDSAGDVGIGSTNPAAKLHIQTGSVVTPASGTDIMVSDSSGSAYINLVSNVYGSTGLYLGDTADVDRASVLYSNYYDAMTFTTNASERMRIDSTGDVLIGTTSGGSYGAKLRVQGRIETSTGITATSNGSYFFNGGYFGGATIVARGYTNTSSATQKLVQFGNLSGTEKGSITISGSTTTYNTSSDERLKENIRDADDAGDRIDAIKIRQFDWIEGGEHQDYGVIAQELLPVAPEAVTKGYTEDDMMGVDYSKLVPTLIKEIQSLRKRVEELEKDK